MAEEKTQGKPTHKERVGGVQITEWTNKSKDGKEFKTISLQRSYKDKDGKWQNTNSFKISDIHKIQTALQKMFEHNYKKEKEEE